MRESKIEWDSDGARATIKPPPAEYTVIHDVRTNRTVIRLPGIVVLPVGALVELSAPDVAVEVQRVRLLACSKEVAAHVCLDVEVPREYWTGGKGEVES